MRTDRDDPELEETICELGNRSLQADRFSADIQPGRCPNHHDQCQHLCRAERFRIAIKKITRGLDYAAALAGVGILIEIKFQNLAFGKRFFQTDSFQTFEPAGPGRAGPRVPHPDYLLADRTGSAH